MDDVEAELKNIGLALENKSFAFDLLSEFKKTNKRMFSTILALIFALVLSNGYWLYTFTQYDFIDVDNGSYNVNYLREVGEIGDINNGDKDKIEKEQQIKNSSP